MLRRSLVTYSGLVVLGLLSIAAAGQLQAGREMIGTTLFYPSHPYNRAFSLVNSNFIGINQLIVIAHSPSEAAFRDPRALEAIEAFQHHMAEDDRFGGALAITGLTKSITRMFHEDVPKWEIIPDDIDSAGQVIFRIISSAATPSEVERFLSTDFHTTAVTLFYRDYSPSIIERALARAHQFTIQQDGKSSVEFRVGGGILGVLAAVHAAVEGAYWRVIGVLALVAGAAAVAGAGTFRVLPGAITALVLTQGALLTLLWLGNIDLNMYTLPLIIIGAGTLLIPLLLLSSHRIQRAMSTQGVVATNLTLAAAAAVWLFSPLRLQAEMGVFLIVLALVVTVIPLCLQKSLTSRV
jgi:predicted RND superfamily exporter protein